MPQCGTLCLGKCVRLVEAISQCRTVSRPCGRTVWRGCRPTCVTACVTCVTTCGCRPACVTAMLAAFQADVTWDFSPQSVPPRKTETRSDSLPLTGRFLMLQNRFIQLAEQMRQRFQKKNWWALYCWGRFTAYNLSKCLNDISFLCLFQHPVMCSSWQKQCLILLNCTIVQLYKQQLWFKLRSTSLFDQNILLVGFTGRKDSKDLFTYCDYSLFQTLPNHLLLVTNGPMTATRWSNPWWWHDRSKPKY